jgi:RND family efflux transporter MFP subunit
MKNPARIRFALVCMSAALTLSACEKKPEEKKSGPPPAIITTTQAAVRDVPVLENSIGEADSATSPKIGAEVGGRIIKVHVEIGDEVKKGQLLAEMDASDYASDARRLEAQAAAQHKLTERYRELARKGFVSPSKVEEIESQNVASREQLTRASKNLSRTRVIAPLDGRVENRFVSVGDWIDLGKPMFQLSTSETLRIRLPFPETVAEKIRPGQAVALTTPTAPGKTMSGKIAQLRPMVGTSSRSFDAIVEVRNPGSWQPGASVKGEVVLEIHTGAITVPEQSVVLRPAGTVVYAVENEKALQRKVKTGVRQAGYVEILEGLNAGEQVAVDGAGYLTDQAKVAIKQPEQNGAKPAEQAK